MNNVSTDKIQIYTQCNTLYLTSKWNCRCSSSQTLQFRELHDETNVSKQIITICYCHTHRFAVDCLYDRTVSMLCYSRMDYDTNGLG